MKTRLASGPWASREQAIDALCALLTEVRIQHHPTTSPKETISAKVGGTRYNLMLERGMLPEDVFWTAQQYDHAAQLQVVRGCGITPRIVFDSPRWLVHVTGVGTMDGPRKMDTWMLIRGAPDAKGGFTLPDGMGGTFGYSSDNSFGPYRDNFELITKLRTLGVTSVGDVSTDVATDPPLDAGRDRCAR